MASRFANLRDAFSNVKIRTMMILTLGIVALVMIVGFLGFRRSNNASLNTAQLARPGQLNSVPGLSPTSPQYAQIQQQVNQQNYQSALANQGTTVPTIVNQQNTLGSDGLGSDSNNSNILGNGNGNGNGNTNGQGANGIGGNGSNLTNSGANGTDNLNSAELKNIADQQKAQLDAMQQKLDALSSQENQQVLQQTQANMQKEAQNIMASWNGDSGTPNQAYVAGEPEKVSPASTNPTPTLNANQSALANLQINTDQPIVKAGSILFASLDTAVNSDEPGPIMATIVTGPYKGTKLIGSIQNSPAIPGSNGPEKLILSFTMMNVPYLPQSIDVTAVAIDPDTARTALASDVNHHYVERYGSLFASSFLEGYGQAVTQAGSTVTVSPFGGTNTQFQQLNPEQEVAAGLGQVGESWGQQLGQTFNRKNTIEISAGISIGILFLDDVDVDTDNTPQNNTNTPVNATANSTQNVTPATPSLTPVAVAPVPTPSQS